MTVEQHLRRCFEGILPRADAATCLLFPCDFNEPDGSALPLSIEESLLLVTTAHCLRSRLRIPETDGELVGVVGETWWRDPRRTDARYQRAADVRLVSLGPGSARFLAEAYGPLTPTDLECSPIPNRSHALLLCGVPRGNVSHPAQGRFGGGVLAHFDQEVDASAFPTEYQGDPSIAAVRHDRDRVVRGPTLQTGPKPKGMSGSGIWGVRDLLAVPPGAVLVGILTEFDDAANLVLGERTHVVISMLRVTQGADIPDPRPDLDVVVRPLGRLRRDG